MPSILLLRFDAPLMSFGGVAVDNLRVTWPHPGRAQLTGLLGNALGWAHGDAPRLQALQGRIRWACRRDSPGLELVDFHTVDLGQPSLVDAGWTTSGAREDRAGASGKGTHIRYCHYWADALYTVALALEPADEHPTVQDLEAALAHPARPLFLGRKCCLPASPILQGLAEARSPLAALRSLPRAQRHMPHPRERDEEPMTAWWSEGSLDADSVSAAQGPARPLVEDRDWANQIHVGRRWLLSCRLPGSGDIDVC